MSEYQDELKFFKMAKDLNEKHAKLFSKEKEEVHVRGNLKSMSLISLSEDTPELGFSSIKTEKTILNKLKNEFKNLELGKLTPEKELQAWIIKKAISNKHILPFGGNIKFITSEMAIKNNDGKRIVNDILGFHEEHGIFVIELKSDRAMTRLIEQVNSFEKIIENNTELFNDLLKIHDCSTWDKKSITKVIVWPHSENGQKSSKYLSSKDVGIIEYGYKKTLNDTFEFRTYED